MDVFQTETGEQKMKTEANIKSYAAHTALRANGASRRTHNILSGLRRVVDHIAGEVPNMSLGIFAAT